MQILMSASIVAQPPDTVGTIVWYPPIQLSDSAHNAYQPRIALSGDDTIHVTWWYGTWGVRLPYVRSVSGGDTFESIRELLIDSATYPNHAFRPFVVAQRNKVNVFFSYSTSVPPFDTPLRMIRSSDYGSTWSNVFSITPDNTGGFHWVTFYSNSLALIYDDSRPEELNKLLRSTNNGDSWSRTDENYDNETRIALTGGSLHLVQHTWRPPAVEINYRRSSNLGDSWEIDTVISDVDGYYSDLPTIAGYDNECGTELLAAWRDTKYGVFGFAGASIISRPSLSNGNQWLPENLITQEPKYFNPAAAVHANVRAVTFPNEVTFFDTFHAAVTGTNSSLTHYTPVFDLTPNIHNGGNPAVAVSSHAIHVVYEQLVGSTFRIFYRRGEFIQKDVSFSLSTGLIEKGAIPINTTASETVYVSNSGTDTLVIGTAISTDENFTVAPAETTVAPGGSTAITVLFTPKTIGEHTGKIIFYHNGQTSPDCISVTTEGKWQEEQLAYATGWNLVSIPLLPGPAQRLPQMFAYENGYVKRDTMHLGIGYWAKFPVDSVVTFQGVGVEEDTFDVKVKWNMIGSLTVPVTVSSIQTIPDSIIVSSFYGYSSSGYFTADTLLPGRAYWVKVKQEGKMILKGTMKK